MKQAKVSTHEMFVEKCIENVAIDFVKTQNRIRADCPGCQSADECVAYNHSHGQVDGMDCCYARHVEGLYVALEAKDYRMTGGIYLD